MNEKDRIPKLEKLRSKDMWPWTGEVTFNIMQVMSGDGSEYFNYFFTLVSAFGLFSFGIGCLVKIVSRS